jgi:hypothetical protein
MAETITTDEEIEPTEKDLEEPLAEDIDNGDWDELSNGTDVDSDEDAAEEGSEESSEEEALDELEAEELEMLTEDEAEETLVIDEAAELRAIRLAEIAMDASEGTERLGDEFQCQSCFLVKKTSQLADKKRQYCRDCV